MNVLDHKTKILGIVTVALGFVQAYTPLKDMVPELTYQWIQMVIGLGVVVCGFLNSKDPLPPVDYPHA